MHDEIIRYYLDGTLNSTNVVAVKENLIHFLEQRMRDDGCVPHLDLEPQFSRDYDESTETYQFKLTVYGTFVGEEAWASSGVTSGKTMKRPTTPPAK
jgi:hypothetical protein